MCAMPEPRPSRQGADERHDYYHFDQAETCSQQSLFLLKVQDGPMNTGSVPSLFVPEFPFDY